MDSPPVMRSSFHSISFRIVAFFPARPRLHIASFYSRYMNKHGTFLGTGGTTCAFSGSLWLRC